MEWTAKENIEIFGDPAHWFDYIEREEKVRMRINCGFVVDFARETLLPPFGMNGNTFETKPTANVYTNRFGIEFMGNYWLSLPFFCSTSNCTALRSLEVERTSKWWTLVIPDSDWRFNHTKKNMMNEWSFIDSPDNWPNIAFNRCIVFVAQLMFCMLCETTPFAYLKNALKIDYSH